jgi:nickel transport protein
MLSIKIWFIFLIIFLPLKSYAHRINLFVDQVGSRLEVAGFFPDGSPCKSCEIEVLDKGGRVLHTTKTDDLGKATLFIQEAGNLKVVLRAGEGHRAEKEIKVDLPKRETQVSPKPRESSKGKTDASETQLGKDTINISEEKFNEILTEIRVLRKEILEMRKNSEKIWFRDILSALGYLLGVWALISLLKRKNAS